MRLTMLLLALLFVPPLVAVSQTSPSALTPVAATAPTVVPALVPYSGVAVKSDGTPLSGESSITFLIFKEQNGGEPLFAETQNVAFDSEGRYKVQLGAASPSGLPAEVFATGEARWLEAQIAGQAPQPRALLASVPYAMKAADAATLGGLPVSAFALAGSTGTAVAAAPNGTHPDVVSNVTTTGGTAGYVPEFNGTSTIIDSPIFVLGSDVGIGTTTPTAPLTVSGNSVLNGALTVNGDSTFNGPFVLPPPATATASKGYNSQFIKIEGSAWNSSTSSAVNPRFQWVGEIAGNNTATPTITLNLISSTTTASPTETGFHFNANGTMQFAASQTFPGADITGTVNAAGYNLGGMLFATGSVSGENAYLGFAGNKSSTGVENTGTGYQALFSNTTGANNVAAGTIALFANTTGGANTATGYAALAANTGGSQNTAAGFDALSTNTVGNGNNGSGAYALSSNTAGSYNTADGYSASYSNTTGNYNTATGTDAMLWNATGNYNTGLGENAGPDSGSTALTNSTAVGANAIVSQNNTLVLGNTTVGSPGASFVNVGIGTATPRSTLETAVSAPAALGPVLTLTNPGGKAGAGSAVDFNSYIRPGSYNPEARIQSADDGDYSDDLQFLSNVPGAPNNGLQQNMVIQGNGLVEIGPPAAFTTTYQVEIFGANGNSGVSALAGFSTSSFGNTGGFFEGGEVSGSGTGGDAVVALPGASSTGPAGYAGFFEGDVQVDGTLTAGSKDFKIDHPLDPANKYLYHASVESSEMMNIYTGNITTDELGLATVKLPDWFEAENTDFRYQLTVIGRKAQAWVAEEVGHGEFKIASDATHTKVSWQITAVRQDVYAKAHPLAVEQEKPERERGYYIHPELFGQPEEKRTDWARHPQQMQQLRALREQRRLQANGAVKPELNHEQPASAVDKHFPVPPAPVPARPVPHHAAQAQTISQLNSK